MEGLSSLTGVVRLHEVCMPVQAAAAKAVYLSWEEASSLAAPIATGSRYDTAGVRRNQRPCQLGRKREMVMDQARSLSR